MAEKNRLDFLQKALGQLPRELRAIQGQMAVLGVKFFKESFRRQGFVDKIYIPWRRRKGEGAEFKRRLGDSKTRGRAVLIQTGDLRRSIKGQSTGGQIRFSSDLPYSKIHNDGGTVSHPGGTPYIVVSKTSGTKAVFVSKAKKKELEAKGRTVKVTKPHAIKIPRRRYMGPSQVLFNELSRMAEKRLEKLFK